MTKGDLIREVGERLKIPTEKAESIVNAIFDAMAGAIIRGDRVEIRGFGNFEVRQYKSYTGRNPKTGEPIEVAPKRLPLFKVGKELRERVNRGRPTETEEASGS